MWLKKAGDQLERSADDHLSYVHIGKCGGSTLQKAIAQSPELAARFSTIRHVHTRRPVYKVHNKYVFVVRNPVDRTLSAFNWRYHLVVETKRKNESFVGEHDALKRYRTLNALAEALYDNGILNARVARDYRSIQHLRQDIAFYLEPLLPHLRPDQIFAVLCQHRLDEDIVTYLGFQNTKSLNNNSSSVDRSKLFLSDQARHNLRKFLAPEYACLERLCTLFPLDEMSMVRLGCA